MACYLPGGVPEPALVPPCDTRAEQAALAALRRAYPALAASYGPALRKARAVALGKLWVALSRERIDGLIPSIRAGRATLLLPGGTRLSAPLAITDVFAEHPVGLAASRHGAPPQLIDHPVALVTAIMAVCSHGADRWRQLSVELGESVANHALALVGESRRCEQCTSAGTSEGESADNSLRWAARRAATDPSFSPLALFEQAVVDGHPLHPGARLRGGMTTEELFAYAPEWAEQVEVGIVAIAQSSFTQSPFARGGITELLRRWHPDLVETAEAHLRGVRRDPAGYQLLPVHPWQLARVLAHRYPDALADRRVIAIPRARIPARPLLSLRTLAPTVDRRAAHLKTAVDIRITTATRLVSPAAVHNGPVISALLAEICRREHGFGGRFVSLGEWASGGYRPAPGEPGDAAAHLAAIARESPERYTSDGEVALPATALAARSPRSGRPLCAEVLDELALTGKDARSDTAARFLASYCDCLLPALLVLLTRWGIALEAHGQNVVVVVRGGLPVRVLYRDFGGIRVSRARLTRCGLRPPKLVGALVTEDEDELRAKLFFPLVNGNLSQVIAVLARVGQADSPRLWGLVARCARSVYATLTAEGAIVAQASRDRDALFGPTLPVKSLLRIQMSADPQASQWVAVPNPLVSNPLVPGPVVPNQVGTVR